MLGKNCPLNDKYKLWVTLHHDCFITVTKEETRKTPSMDCDCKGCHIFEERQEKYTQMFMNLMTSSNGITNIPVRGTQIGLLSGNATNPFWSSQVSLPMHTHSLNSIGISPSCPPIVDPPELTELLKPKPSIWKRLWNLIKI